MEGLTRFADLVILNILWILLCVPVVTAVPATIALYYAAVKVVRRQAGYPLRDFFHGFKENIKQGAFLSVIYALLGLILYTAWDFSNGAALESGLGGFFIAFWLVLLFITVCVSLYLIPVISRFQMPLSSAVRLAVAMAFANLKTVVPMVFTLIGGIVLVYFWPPAIMVVPSFYFFLLSFSVEKVLIAYIKTTMLDLESHKHRWYMAE